MNYRNRREQKGGISIYMIALGLSMILAKIANFKFNIKEGTLSQDVSSHLSGFGINLQSILDFFAYTGHLIRFNFFPTTGAWAGFEGSTRFISITITYFVIFSIIIVVFSILFRYLTTRKRERDFINNSSMKKRNILKYLLVPFVAFYKWYKKGLIIYLNDKPDQNYEFKYFLAFNFILLYIDFIEIIDSFA